MPVYNNDPDIQALYLLNNTWADESPNGNDLTAVNSPTFNNSDFQEGTHSADFESGSSQRAGITDGSQSGLDITGSISFGAWVKPESGGANRCFMGKSNITGSQRSYHALRTSSDAFSAIISPDGGTGSAATCTGVTIASNGSWYHVVIVYNGTDVRLYVNGSLDTNGASNPVTYSGGIFNCSSDFQLGARGDSGQFWDGLVDEAFVIDRALTADEVADIYADGFPDEPDPEPEPEPDPNPVVINIIPRRGIGQPKFELWLTTDEGTRLASLSTAVQFSGSKVANGIGEFWYQPTNSFDLTLLKPDSMVQFWYEPYGGDKFLFNTYMLRNFRYRSRSIEFGGPDVNSLLTRRIVAAKAGSSQAKKAAMACDDMMKEYVAESLLNTADPIPSYGTRAWSNLTIDSDLSQGPTLSGSFPFKSLLTLDGGGVLPILAKQAKERGTEVFYGVRPNIITRYGLTFIFWTKINYPGSDVSDFVTFDEASGNLLEPDLTMDYTNEANYIYATGQGEESQRYVAQVWDAARVNQSIWGRIESEADSRHLGVNLEVENNGYSALFEGQPKIKFTGRPGDTEGTQFGVHWNFGDVVKTKYKFIEFLSIIRTVTISVDPGGYSIDTRLDYES